MTGLFSWFQGAAGGMRGCFENRCAEGTLECGSVSYRLWSGSQGAARIFMKSGEPKDHEVDARNEIVAEEETSTTGLEMG